MEQLIGLTIKTHGSGYVGKVKQVERIYVKPIYRKQFGIESNEPYLSVAVQIDESPNGWTTLIGRDGFEILKRYVLA